MLLWLLAFWLLAHGAIPGVLDMLGLEREELASHGQVLLVQQCIDGAWAGIIGT